MRYPAALVIAASLFLGACRGSPQQERAERVEEQAEAQAEAIEESAEDAPEPVQEAAERNAQLTLEAGENRAEAIRDSEGKVPETAE